MRPLLFLDVDGVLNVMSLMGKPDTLELTASHGEYVTPAYLSPDMPGRVAQLAEYFEIIWATAWQGLAHPTFREACRLPEHCEYIAYTTNKLPEILKRANDRPFAWVDDDIDFELDQLGWTRDRHLPDNSLLIQPSMAVGLTDDHVIALLRFANQLASV